jgi:hypothetical protein
MWNFFFNFFSLNFLSMKISIQLSALIILSTSFDLKFIRNSDVFDQYLRCTFSVHLQFCANVSFNHLLNNGRQQFNKYPYSMFFFNEMADQLHLL